MCSSTFPLQNIPPEGQSLALQTLLPEGVPVGRECEPGELPGPARCPLSPCPAPGDVSSLSLALPESTDVAFSITMLLASLSSCCNPWIYLFFSGHLLQDAGRCRGCWGRRRAGLRRPNSTGSLCSRKTTILSHSHQAGVPLHGDSARELYPPCDEGVTESGTL